MPVDLSMTGIQGQLAGQQLIESRARIQQSQQNAQKEAFELDQLTRQQALADKAASMLNSIAMGKKTHVEDGERAAAGVGSLAEPLETVADLYMRGGAPEKGMEFLKSASEIRKRENDIENDEVLAKQRKLENIIKGADVVSRYIGGAANQSEWNYGVEQLRAQGIMEPEFIEKLGQMEYDPNVSAYFRQQAISAKDQATLEIQAQTQARLEKTSAVQLAQGERRIALQKAQRDETKRHNLQMEKARGTTTTALGAPKADEIKSVKSALRTSVFKDISGEDDPAFDAAANYVSSQASYLIKNNKALSWDVAVQRAIMQGQQAGAFDVEPEQNNWFTADKPAKAKFDAAGISPDAPLPMPKSKAAMKKGRYYMTARGRAQWNGSAFVPVE